MEERLGKIEDRLGNVEVTIATVVAEKSMQQKTLDELTKISTQTRELLIKVESLINVINTDIRNIKKAQDEAEEERERIKKQRDIDHLESPLSWVSKVSWLVVSALIAYLLGKFGL